jgi:hypothetical protein
MGIVFSALRKNSTKCPIGGGFRKSGFRLLYLLRRFSIPSADILAG